MAIELDRQTVTRLRASFPDNLVKPAPERLKQEMMGWQWHQLDHIQIICTLLQTDNDVSMPSFHFYRPDALHDTQPTVSKQ